VKSESISNNFGVLRQAVIHFLALFVDFLFAFDHIHVEDRHVSLFGLAFDAQTEDLLRVGQLRRTAARFRHYRFLAVKIVLQVVCSVEHDGCALASAVRACAALLLNCVKLLVSCWVVVPFYWNRLDFHRLRNLDLVLHLGGDVKEVDVCDGIVRPIDTPEEEARCAVKVNPPFLVRVVHWDVVGCFFLIT
jgi:hypothetical protein